MRPTGVIRLAVALSAALVALAPLATGAAAPHWGLPELMQELGAVRFASGEFTESKTLHMLKRPLVSSGTLVYVAPDRMEKDTLTPAPERFVLDGNEVTISGTPDKETKRLSLTRYPEVAGLVEGIRATLAGDLATLQRFYVVQLTGDAADWRLKLRPKGEELAHFVKWIRIQGSRDRIETVTSESPGGDITEMSVNEDVIDAR